MADNGQVKFITIKAAANLLGVSPLTLRNWDKKKKLLAYRHPINNYRVYKLDEIQSFLERIGSGNKPKKVKIQFFPDMETDKNPASGSTEEDFKI